MKKSVLSFIFIICFTQIIFSQACGVYNLKYVGEIVSNNDLSFKIKLPNTFFYHSNERKNNNEGNWIFDYVKVNNRKIDVTVTSHLGSLCTSDQLIELYKKSRDFIPIFITFINKEGEEKRSIKKVSFKKIKFSGKDISGKPTLIIIDLGEIRV
ncbi:hypothetical protein [uncultured Tenacibaculum sp.]|uniref:hypothetical protein n=1 Tax=uncultured Tenacibaculum sp. TaxID=174713 RepID=UPI002609DA15|nr:hypothetical protein [uncultured Tenacibaculum sp.]